MARTDMLEFPPFVERKKRMQTVVALSPMITHGHRGVGTLDIKTRPLDEAGHGLAIVFSGPPELFADERFCGQLEYEIQRALRDLQKASRRELDGQN